MDSFTKNSVVSLIAATLLLTACGGGDSGSAATSSTSTVATGTSSVSGSTGTNSSSSGSSSAKAFKATASLTTDGTISATLTVDLNNNGEFGDATDPIFTAPVKSDGSFDFGAVKVNAEGETRAQLLVSKDGYAPVTKIITLKDGQDVSVIADAASTPLLTDVVDITTLRTNGTLASSFLQIGTKNTNGILSSYAKVVSLSDLQASADVPIDADVETITTIPLAALPDDVTSITAQTQSFDPTDEKDAEKFPGDYVGVGEPGKGEQQLVSVSFDYMSLTDQNGDPITLDTTKLTAASKLMPQAIDYTSCLRTSTRHLNSSQLELFKKYGDDDNTTTEFEVPLWYYNRDAGNWQYLGQAEIYGADGTTDFDVNSTDTYGYAKMCITENWGTSVNLDYSITPEQPVNVCVEAKDQNGEAVSNLYVYAKKDTAYEGNYLDEEGKAQIALLAGSDPTQYEFAYYGALTGWNKTNINSSTITAGGAEGCNNTLTIDVVNPYSAELRLTVKNSDGTPAVNKYVYVYNSSWGDDYYYKSTTTDTNGLAIFKVKPDTNYGAYYKGTVVDVNINGSTVSPETADNGRIAAVELQEIEVAPSVYLYTYNYNISDSADSMNFYVSAYDENGDTINLTSLTLNGIELQEGTDYSVEYRYSSNNYDYFYAKLNLASATVSTISPASLTAGNYSLEATYSDGILQSSDSKRFSVNVNRPPIVSAVYLYNTTEGYFYINDNLHAGTYNIDAYAYDLDSDDVTISYVLDGSTTDGKDVTIHDGEHTLIIQASDGTLDTNRTFDFYVGNHAPQITSFGATNYSVDLSSDNKTIKLFAYATDPDGDPITLQTVDGNITLTPLYSGSTYFESDDISIDTNTTFNIYANDGDKNSTVKSVEITTYQANKPPVFTTELSSVNVAIGETVDFICVATDPEGLEVSYEWFVNDEKQSATGTTFSSSFTQPATITCKVTDADPLEPKSVISTATVSVYDPTASGDLVINTIPGAIVATHNTDTLEPLQAVTADIRGIATLNVNGSDHTTFSVSVSPDLTIDKNNVFKLTLMQMNAYLYGACVVNTIQVPEACSDYNKDTFESLTAIPNNLLDIALANEEISASDIDTDSNGYVDTDENFIYALEKYDTNSDASLTFGEFTYVSEVQSTFFVNVSVDTYDVPLYILNVEPDYYYGSYTWTNTPTTITFTNFNANTTIHLNEWTEVVTDENGSATFSSDYFFGSYNDKYAYAFYYLDENNVTKYVLGLEKTAEEVATLSFTPTDFTLNAKTVTFITNENNTSMFINATYKSTDTTYYNSALDSAGSDSYNKNTIIDSSALTYIFGAYDGIYNAVTNSEVSRYQWNFYGDGTLKDTYDMQDYPMLDAAISFDGVDTINFSGNELNKVNYGSIYMYLSGTKTDGTNFDLRVTFNYLTMPTATTLPNNFASILPEVIGSSVDGNASLNDASVNLIDFREVATGIETTDADTSNGYRTVNLWISSNTAAASSIQNSSKAKFIKPFTIAVEVKSLYAE